MTRLCWVTAIGNRPRLVYQYSNMALRLSGQNCNLRSCCPSVPEPHLDTKKTTPNIEVCPESHVGILIYWYILNIAYWKGNLRQWLQNSNFLDILPEHCGEHLRMVLSLHLVQTIAKFCTFCHILPFPVFYQWNITKKPILFGHPDWFCPLICHFVTK